MEKPPTPPRLLIFHPSDLQSGLVAQNLYLRFRQIFASNGSWQVIPLVKMKKTLGDYKIDMNIPCNELNCACDAGSVINAQYAIYSSFRIFQNYYMFSINLVNISRTKVVWAKNGEIPIKAGENANEALLRELRLIVGGLKPEDLEESNSQPKGTLCILNLSPDSEDSQILFERLSTYAYSSGVFELVDEAVLKFILASQEIQPSAIIPTKDTLLSIGKKMGVDYLLYSRLEKESGAHKIQLALCDINKNALIRERPYRSSSFGKLLKFENKFIAKITQPDIPTRPSISLANVPIWKWIAVPISIVASGVLGYVAWNEHQHGNDKYAEWYASDKTLQEIKRRPGLESEVKQARFNRNVYVIMGGILISGSIVLVSF